MKSLSFLVVVGGVLVLQSAFLWGQGQQQQSLPSPSQISGAVSSFGDAVSRMDKALNPEDYAPTPEDEYYLGRAVAANILATYKSYNGNQALTLYLNRICQTLVINSPRPEIFNGYHLIILDSPEYNAFATPGGHIFVTRGLVAAATSEEALAGIIAHEIAHIILKHSLSLIDNMKLTEEISTAAVRAAELVGKGNEGVQRALAFRDSVSGIVNTMIKNGYSKTQEFEADATALELMADAGYDPNGLLDMLKTLQKVQSSQRGGFNSTHPTPADRIANAEKTVTRYRTADTRSFRAQRFINK